MKTLEFSPVYIVEAFQLATEPEDHYFDKQTGLLLDINEATEKIQQTKDSGGHAWLEVTNYQSWTDYLNTNEEDGIRDF